jgi:hypothetical protein
MFPILRRHFVDAESPLDDLEIIRRKVIMVSQAENHLFVQLVLTGDEKIDYRLHGDAFLE